MMMNLGTFIPEPLVNSVVYKESDDDIEVTLDKEQFLSDCYIAHVTPPAYTPSLPFLTTMEPTYTLLMGMMESEMTSDSNLECDMSVNTPLPTTDVREENFDINSPLGEQELTAEIDLDDSIPTEMDNGYYDSEGDILYLEQLLIEDTSFDLSPALLPKESYLLVTPPPASKQFSLREVKRFDPFFSLTQSGGKTRVMETPSFGFHHMPSPRPAAYSPKEVMYRYYHPYMSHSDNGGNSGIQHNDQS
ncbi:hypothetical protein Tco_0957300 [Tanacetum coccineum]